MTPRISAIVCTHNRSDLLAQALQSLCRQNLPDDDFELLIVDNASTDDTEAIARSSCDGQANFTYIAEPKLGLSRARNRGIREASGTYVAFLDDDAVAEPDWLEKILAAFAEAEPPPGCVGGKTLPSWEEPRPHWLHEALVGSLSIIDWSSEAFFIEPPYFLVGANIAYDRGLILEVGGFDERIGRVGQTLLSGEETELVNRVRAAGSPIYYTPKAVVRHLVSRSRLTKSWHFERAKWHGISECLVRRGEGWRGLPKNFGEAAKELLNPRLIRQMGRALASPRPQVRFLFQTLIWARLNYVRTVLTGGPRLTEG
jgi:GT2 family glycosyltransferase